MLLILEFTLRHFNRIQLNKYIIRFRYWEFWPTWVVYLPVLLCYPIWAIRSKSLFFFALANPTVTMGGLYGTSKSELLNFLASHQKPTSIRIGTELNKSAATQLIRESNIELPLVIKPEFGERGKGVEFVKDKNQLQRAIAAQTSDFQVQSYINWTFEAGVFYIRMPGADRGKVTSIVTKGFLEITGDGASTLEKLTKQQERGILVWERLKHAHDSNIVLKNGQSMLLEPIGNHSRGTAFNDGNRLISLELENWANNIANRIPKFHYGRFDVRAASEADFMQGKNIVVLEVNGVNAEPAHIYQRGYSLLNAWKTLMIYWQRVFTISRINSEFFDYPSLVEAHRAFKTWRSITSKKYNS